jgi:hypothetical protein
MFIVVNIQALVENLGSLGKLTTDAKSRVAS